MFNKMSFKKMKEKILFGALISIGVFLFFWCGVFSECDTEIAVRLRRIGKILIFIPFLIYAFREGFRSK